MSCGRSLHVELGFGKGDTSTTAAYSPALCAAYAAGLAKAVLDCQVDADSSRKRLRVTTDGKVRRHVDRGATELSRKEVRAAEDAACWAGARNCFDVVSRWPELLSAMKPVGDVLRLVRADKKAVPDVGQRVWGRTDEEASIREGCGALAP